MRGEAAVRGVDAALVAALVVVAAVAASSAAAAGADLAAGKAAAGQCTVCHGKNGIGTNPEVPNLAGESSYYIAHQLEAYRSGARQHPQMSIVAQGLDDPTIAAVAAWFEAMKVTVELPALE